MAEVNIVKDEDIEINIDEKIQIRLITWNVGNEEPKKSQVRKILGNLSTIDILVVGFQEAVYKSKESYSGSNQCKGKHLPSLIETCIAERALKFVTIACVNFGEIFLHIMVNPKIKKEITW